MDRIVTLIRSLIEDVSTKGVDVFTYDVETTFNLSESNLIINSIKVYINGVETSNFNIDYDTCKLILIPDSGELNIGDSIEVRYNYYPSYSDIELERYIASALAWLSVCRYHNSDWEDGVDDFIIGSGNIITPEPIASEERLIALIADILIRPNFSYRIPDFSITIRDSESKEDKIKKIIKIYKLRLGRFDIIDKDSV